MSLQEKYQPLIDMASSAGISDLSVSEGDGFITIEGTAPSAEVKQQLWDEYNSIDPDYRSGDLVLNITSPESTSTTYTVVSGDSLSRIASHHGTTWKAIFDANRDKIDDPNEIYPGQELTIPQG